MVLPLREGSTLYANFTHSYRAPALEELYFNGPHVGNLAFERGNDRLDAERANGIEAGVRRRIGRLRGEWNAFHYRFRDFVYLARGTELEDGLPLADYLQGDANYTGTEFKLSYDVTRWFVMHHQADLVRASLRANGPLPRIPPARMRHYADLNWRAITLRPELLLANRQDRVYTTETPTAGYGVVQFGGFYSIARQHALHSFNFLWFNAGNRLYRNHLNFLKDTAPEIGRGFRVGYTLNFY
jgi:iron complex outermembrane recepter protein